jgi:hypothetical protein
MKDQVKKETRMRSIILTIVGAAVIAGSTTQVAFSMERHHVRSAQQFNSERFRNANAYTVPSYVPATRPAYSGEAGAWQAMTGFN